MLKDTITHSFKELITNRYLTVLSVVTIILAIAFVIYIGIVVRPSELQLVTHYTAYGVTHLYRDQWFYLLSFGGFAVIVAFLNVAISLKVFLTKGHPLAIMFAWFGVGIMVFAWITSFSIINVWSPL
ncbi:MAG: hypothetical protein JWO54_604 [Candidatus Saccharibacteria bacterium]|nr:hypothetical protein [Candidatus Saccharibacteria bacterium]MDB5180844.1 hypothetical protein [Candidatus Saccharibacteria bacterium]